MYNVVNVLGEITDGRETIEEACLSASYLLGNSDELVIEKDGSVVLSLYREGISSSINSIKLVKQETVVNVCKQFIDAYKIREMFGYKDSNSFLKIENIEGVLSLSYHYGSDKCCIDMTENISCLSELLNKVVVECCLTSSDVSKEYLETLYIPLVNREDLGLYAFHNKYTGYLEYVVLPVSTKSFIEYRSSFKNNFLA